MTRRLLVEPSAESDLRAAFDWYDARRHGLGREFLAAVGRRLAKRAAVPHFPHFVFYLARQGAIVAVAIMPQSRRPDRRSASPLHAALR